MNTPEHAMKYEIRVLDALDARWSVWFAGLDVSSSAIGETTMTGPLRDQAESRSTGSERPTASSYAVPSESHTPDC
jgi:hypothetical protein